MNTCVHKTTATSLQSKAKQSKAKQSTNSLITFFTFVFLFSPQICHADITTGLVDYYKFDEGSGSTVIDSGSGGINGTEGGSPTYVTGKIGSYALSFNGSNYVAVPALNSYPNGKSALSIACWFKNTGGEQDRSNIVGWWNNNNFRIDFHNGGGGYAEFSYDTTGGDQVITSGSAYADNAWHHAVGTYDTTTGANFYIDGALIGNNAANGTLVSGDDFDVATYQYHNALFFTGSVDDVRTYNRALTSSDATQLYNQGTAVNHGFARFLT